MFKITSYCHGYYFVVTYILILFFLAINIGYLSNFTSFKWLSFNNIENTELKFIWRQSENHGLLYQIFEICIL